MTEYKKQNIILNSIFCLFIICEILNFFLLPYETVFNSMGERKTATLFRLLQAHGMRVCLISNVSFINISWFPDMLPYLFFIGAMIIGMAGGKKFFWSFFSALAIFVGIFMIQLCVTSGSLCSGFDESKLPPDFVYEGGWIESNNSLFDTIHCVFYLSGIVFLFINCYYKSKQSAVAENTVSVNETALTEISDDNISVNGDSKGVVGNFNSVDDNKSGAENVNINKTEI